MNEEELRQMHLRASRKWKEKNKQRVLDYNKLWRTKNREKWLACLKKHYIKNREHIRQQKTEWYLKHKAECRERSRVGAIKYRRENPQKIFAQNKANNNVQIGDECELCGSNTDLCKHHPDYSEPLIVVTLCRDCHTFIHRKI